MDHTQNPLSRQALSKILDALEQKTPINRRELATLASASPSTTARAVGYLTQVGLLTPSHHTQTEHPSGLLSLNPAAILPVLTLNHGFGAVYALNARMELLGTAITELSRKQDGRACMRALGRRAMILLHGCANATGLPVTAPVLLTESSASVREDPSEVMIDTMGVAPLAILDESAAIAHSLRWEALPENAAFLLYLRTGELHSACLFARSDTGHWVVSPPKQALGEALTRYLKRENGTAEAQRHGISCFIRDLGGFIRPELLLLEDPRGLFREEKHWRSLRFDGMEVLLRESPRAELSLPITGAAGYARRILWERMTGLSR